MTATAKTKDLVPAGPVPRRVLLLNKWFHPEVTGGAETSLYDLACALRDAGTEVTIFCQARHTTPGWDTYDGFRVYRHPAANVPAWTWSMGHLIDHWNAVRWLRRIANEIGDQPMIARTMAYTAIARGAFQNNWVTYWCPGSQQQWFGRFPPGSVKTARDRMWAFIDRRQVETLERWAHGGANLVVAEAGHVGRDLVQRLGVDPAKVVVRRNGIDPSRFRPQPVDTALLEEFGIAAGTPVILTVARLEAMKNHAFLLRAVAAMRERATLLIVGKGGEADRLQQLARELGIADRVRFPGFRTDITRFYSVATAFVLPSVYEPYGNVFSEALGCGLPTIGLRPSATVCVPSDEHVVDGENGFLVDNGDDQGLAGMLDRLASEPNLRARLSVAAAELARIRYDWTTTAREFLVDFSRRPSPDEPVGLPSAIGRSATSL